MFIFQIVGNEEHLILYRRRLACGQLRCQDLGEGKREYRHREPARVPYGRGLGVSHQRLPHLFFTSKNIFEAWFLVKKFSHCISRKKFCYTKIFSRFYIKDWTKKILFCNLLVDTPYGLHQCFGSVTLSDVQ